MADITLVGNVTRDPELRFTTGGRPVVSFGIAENRTWTDNEGEKQEVTSFFNCQAWGTLAENVAQSVTKGQRVVGKGRIEQRTYENDAGEEKTVFEVTLYNVGPDLNWASAEVTKNERTEETKAPSRPSRQTRKTPEDEEPF
jgi:single stranded DNA-binding protein (ssb)